ncbi:MAG: leucine-rich repeat protein [Muribaculaceae bacterium]|nr:leucine-rich repeat protein [Muribaculaceae bacterium]
MSVLWLPLGARVVQTYHVTEPGSLATMMGESWTGIDSLVVTGDINADDVATMRLCVDQGRTTGINLLDAALPNDALPVEAFREDLKIYDEQHVGYDYRLQYITLPQHLRSIGTEAFAYCGLRQIDLPETLESIGDNAFMGCCWLSGKVCVPPLVTSLTGTFSNCERVREVEIQAENCILGNSTFDGMFSLRHLKLPEKWSVNNSSHTFRNCRSLEGEFVISASTKRLNDGLFVMCSSLKRVVMPEYLYSSFTSFDYSGLEDVVWPKSMTWGNAWSFSFRHCKFKQFFANTFMRWVEPKNFAGNEMLEEFGLDPSIELRANALAGCRLLKAVYSVGATPPAITGGNPFPDKRADAVLYVPVGAKDVYQATEYWDTFSQIVELEEFPEWVVSHSRILQQ